MERSLRWRSLFLFVLIALSVVYLLPSVTDTSGFPPWFNRVFAKKIKLGLDLEGGLRIVYGLDLDKAIEDKAAGLKRDLELDLKEKKIEGTVETPPSRPEAGVPVGAVFVFTKDAEGAKKVASAEMMDDYLGQLQKVKCPSGRPEATTVCFRVDREYAEKIRERAVTEVVKIIGDRVDQHGVTEPTIIKKGEDV